MVQKMPNMAPTWTQVEAMLGSRTVLGPPKSEEKTTLQTTSKKHTKGTKRTSHGLQNRLGRVQERTINATENETEQSTKNTPNINL